MLSGNICPFVLSALLRLREARKTKWEKEGQRGKKKGKGKEKKEAFRNGGKQA